MTRLPTPSNGRDAAEAFVDAHLAHLVCDEVRGSGRFVGGQTSADAALAGFDVAGYASRRNEVLPDPRRGASGLSPYIRHGLLTLPQVWQHVAGGPRRDVDKFRDELLWQEYARHWYARLGARTARSVRHELPHRSPGASADELLPRDLLCLDVTRGELERDGWLVNQTRMWLASHWSIRNDGAWPDGEDYFFRHLLDGSRAANRLGWQWVTGAGSSKPYSFSRRQVERRAPGLCERCALRDDCPIRGWPDTPSFEPSTRPERLRRDPTSDRTAGPDRPIINGTPDVVWLTAESLAANDPALTAHPGRPVVFVFDERLLARLQLSSKRLVFLTETLSELAADREVELHLGDPVEVLTGRNPAVTFAPVPGFRRRSDRLDVAELHPWPWLRRPGSGPVTSFSAWRRSLRT